MSIDCTCTVRPSNEPDTVTFCFLGASLSDAATCRLPASSNRKTVPSAVITPKTFVSIGAQPSADWAFAPYDSCLQRAATSSPLQLSARANPAVASAIRPTLLILFIHLLLLSTIRPDRLLQGNNAIP